MPITRDKGMMMTDTYHGGYTKALLDVRDFFEGFEEAFAFHKVLSRKANKQVQSILTSMLNNRNEMMKWGGAHMALLIDKNGNAGIKGRD